MGRVPIPVAIAILRTRGRVFLVRRARGKPLPGRWEFPGGKVEVGEEPRVALRRELREELGIRVRDLSLFGVYSHVYDFPEGPVHYVLLAYAATVRTGPWARKGRWMDARALAATPVVEGSRPIVSALLGKGLVR